MESNALKNEFLVESFENLSTISEDLNAYAKDSTNKEILNKIYRTVHTMKGSASFLGYKVLQELTHSAENLLDALRDDVLLFSNAILDGLIDSFDICHTILKSIEINDSEEGIDINQSKSKLDAILNGDVPNQDPNEVTNLDSEFESNFKDSIEQPKENLSLESESQNFDEELLNLIEEHRETYSYSNARPLAKDKDSFGPPSNAALESLQELIESGRVDSSALDEIALNSSKDGEIESTTNSVDTNTFNADNNLINSAAMESLKELTSSGALDSNILEQLEGGATNQSTDTTPKQSENSMNIVDALDSDGPSITTTSTDGQFLESTKSIADSVVRVNVAVLDKIMNLVGELVLNRNQVVRYSNANLGNNEINRLSQQLNTITSELQSEVMSTRMQPIGSILSKFERLVRDFARTCNKKISLKLSGQETELDKTLIEAIKDPLVHIIRNAADHGLESVEERQNLGKNPQGMIHIKAYNESGQVTIEIIDDGRGLNSEKIKNKAREKKLISEERLEKMSDQQVYNLIFSPGFSTAEKITNISGRGVGMDVVKTNIENIGGTISINSDLGKGTTFKMRIPLTLAIVPALIIRNNNQSFAIPQLNLVELVRLEGPEDLKLIEKISDSEFLRLRGNLTPLFRLESVLELQTMATKSKALRSVVKSNQFEATEMKGITNNSDNDNSLNILILNAENNFFGIIVEEILDTEEIVVKPLNAFKDSSIFGGATIMGDGSVALILDALGFLNRFSILKDVQSENQQSYLNSPDEIQNIGEMQENLLFTLADDRVYAIPLSLVSRLEEFSVNQIERTGNRPIIRYLDAPMPLINVEKTLGLDCTSVLEKYTSENVNAFPCIVANIQGRNYGLIVKEIRDISIDNVEIDDTAVDREGILGTIFIQNKTVSLVDMYTIIEAQGFESVKRPTEVQIQQNQKDRKRILLVDDSAMYRKMETDALSDHGYSVDTGINGEDGLNLLAKNEYDLLITDIEMPVLDGYEFAKRVRENEKFSQMPIVALSTRASVRDKEKGKNAGFDYHLEKFRKDEVLELVANILKRD